MRSPWLALVALALGAALLFGFRLGRRSLENQDSIRNADIAAEMLRSGDWLVPRSCDVVYTERPPVQLWAIAGLGKLLGGVTPLTARLPSLGAGVLLVLMTAGLGAALGSWRTGLAAGVVLATMSDVWVYARTARGEMMFSMLALGAVLALVRGGRLGRSAAALCMALAILEKGPLGIALPGVALAAWAWTAGRERRGLWREAALSALIGTAAAALGYYLPLYLHARPGEFREILGTFLLKENLERVRSGWDHRPSPWWYYGESILTNTLPWGLLLIPAVVAAWPRRWRDGPAEAFLLLWLGGVVLAFSCSAGKEPRYLLPVYPALAILIARLLDGCLATPPAGPTWVRSWCWVLPPVLVGGGLWGLAGRIPMAPSPIAWASGALLACGTFLAWALLRGRLPGVVGAIALAFGIGVSAYSLDLESGDARESTCLALARQVASLVPEGEPLLLYDRTLFRSGFCYYLGRTVPLCGTVSTPGAGQRLREKGWILMSADYEADADAWRIRGPGDTGKISRIAAGDWRPEHAFRYEHQELFLFRLPLRWGER